MRSIVGVLASALLLAAPLLAVPAAAKPSAADQTAIAAVEAAIGPTATARPLAARMAELKVPGVSIAFMVASGPPGRAPIVGEDGATTGFSDPLPQAMVLTAIVITLATTAFVLAMAYRSWQLNGHDDVQDDLEDATIRRLAESDVTSEAYVAASDDVSDPDDPDDPDAGTSDPTDPTDRQEARP